MADSKIYLLITFCLIILLSWVVYQRFFDFQETLSDFSPPQFEMPKTDFSLSQEENEQKFVSPDGRLKIDYPGGWTKTTEDFLIAMNQEGMKLEQAKVLFFAFKVDLGKPTPFFFLIQEINLINLEKIIEVMKVDTEEKDGEMEILSLIAENKIASLEAKYKKGGVYDFLSREKIIILEEKSYLVALFTPEENWLAFTDEADSILNSIEVIQ